MLRFQKVLLVSPPSSSRYGGLRVPAGIGYIAQVLSDDSIKYEYVDMRIGYSWRYLRKKALSFRPDLIGFSMITVDYKAAYEVITGLKQLLPDAKIVAGGHHVTILKEKVLQECKDIDVGVVHDGEKTILELCKGDIPYEDIKGVIFRKDRQLIFNGERPLVENLDEYAFPRYHNFNMKDYSKQIPIHSSRGCVFQCTFCPNKLIGGKFRAKSVTNFVDEIEYWYARGIKQFAVDGGNNKVLGYLKKGETIESIERAIKNACELGFDVKMFIIVGTPHETLADIEDSIRLARKYPVARVNFNNAIPYPGTEMFDYVKEHNLFLIPPEEYLK